MVASTEMRCKVSSCITLQPAAQSSSRRTTPSTTLHTPHADGVNAVTIRFCRIVGTWGEYDLDDAINAVKYLADKGLVDIKRTAITGGSAGGFTVIACLTFRSFFQAGGAHYGVADLIAMAKDTHKFESRYLDGLVGPYPQAEEVYKARSAVYHPDKMVTPMILFQGDEDKVVPPEQSRSLYRALKQKGVPTAYLEFAGEQHGFRQAKNIKRSIEAEYYFYGQIFQYTPADEIEPVEIDNWKKQ